MNTATVYNRLPIFCQNMLCSLYGKRLNSRRYNKTYTLIKKKLIRQDFYDNDELVTLKLQLLSDIVKYAFVMCPTTGKSLKR